MSTSTERIVLAIRLHWTTRITNGNVVLVVHNARRPCSLDVRHCHFYILVESATLDDLRDGLVVPIGRDTAIALATEDEIGVVSTSRPGREHKLHLQ